MCAICVLSPPLPSQAVRPLHVGGALEDRLAPGVHMQLEIIKNKVQSYLSKQLSHGPNW